MMFASGTVPIAWISVVMDIDDEETAKRERKRVRTGRVGVNTRTRIRIRIIDVIPKPPPHSRSLRRIPHRPHLSPALLLPSLCLRLGLHNPRTHKPRIPSRIARKNDILRAQQTLRLNPIASISQGRDLKREPRFVGDGSAGGGVDVECD